MKYLIGLFLIFIGLHSNAQEKILPIKYNPLQSGEFLSFQKNTKAARVQDYLIFQFDTLELPFKEDFSKDHFPDLNADTTDASVSRIKVYSLLDNGVPVDSSKKFTYIKTYQILVDTFGNHIDSLDLSSHTFTYVDYSVYPFKESTITVWPAYNIFDTLNRGVDTFHFVNADISQQSAVKYLIEKDSTDLWMDRYVYRNNDFPINPPSIGVATFDGLDEHGLPYDFNAKVSGNADKMTSVPINLSPYTLDDSVYLSFYYQPQGISPDPPDPEDSLVVDFYDANTSSWVKVWGVRGERGTGEFHQVFILVAPRFYTNVFQFRFRNRAFLAGDFDQWHVDYIYLDRERNIHDSLRKDISFIYSPPSILKEYYSIPWFHYNSNPAVFNKDSVETCFNNHFNQSLSIYYLLEQLNAIDGYKYFQNPTSNSKFVIVNGDTSRCLGLAIEEFPSEFSNKLRPADFQQKEVIESRYSIDFRPASGQEPDFFPENDTVKFFQEFSNYYAYDDGTAEAGFGIVNIPDNIMIQHHNIPFRDSLTALQLYFLPQVTDISQQEFQIVVYNNLNANDLIYESKVLKPFYTSVNGFVTYFLDSNIVVGPSFYVGIRSPGSASLGIGYDLNTPNKNRIYISEDQKAFRPVSVGIPEGSLMMRPVFRQLEYPVGIVEKSSIKNTVQGYPNPSTGTVNFKNVPLHAELRVYNTLGKLIFQGRDVQSINLEEHKAGIYFLQWISKEGEYLQSEKIIIKPY